MFINDADSMGSGEFSRTTRRRRTQVGRRVLAESVERPDGGGLKSGGHFQRGWQNVAIAAHLQPDGGVPANSAERQSRPHDGTVVDSSKVRQNGEMTATRCRTPAKSTERRDGSSEYLDSIR